MAATGQGFPPETAGERIICDVCRDDETDEGNEILLCDGCDCAAHQVCFGQRGAIPDGEWFCRVCERGRAEATATGAAAGGSPGGSGGASTSHGFALSSPAASKAASAAAPSVAVICALCLQGGGVLKPTKEDSNTWCHLSCARWIPEVWIEDPVTMEPICGLSRVSHLAVCGKSPPLSTSPFPFPHFILFLCKE